MGIQQATFVCAAAGSGAVPIIGPWYTSIYATSSTGRTRLTFKTDGSIVHSFDGSVIVNTVGGDKWYGTITAGIGNTHWIRATPSDVIYGGSNNNSGLNTWLQLNADRFWELNLDDLVGGVSAVRSTLLLFQIATDSGGSNIVASSTGNKLFGNYYDSPGP